MPKKNLFARYRQFLHQPALRPARQIVVAVVGGTVVLVGIAMIVLPGPAFVVIPLGLAILGTEFIWAKRWLKKAREMLPSKLRSSQKQEFAVAPYGQDQPARATDAAPTRGTR